MPDPIRAAPRGGHASAPAPRYHGPHVRTPLARRPRRVFSALVAAALSLPVFAPASALGAGEVARAAVDAPAPPITTFEALSAAFPERGPGRHDEGRRLDATLAPARLALGGRLSSAAPQRLAPPSPEPVGASALTRWCIAHGTATGGP